VLASVGIVLLLAAFAPWGVRLFDRRFGYLAGLVSLALFTWFASHIPAISGGEEVSERIAWLPSLGATLAFRLDGLALLFALLITGIGALIALYSVGYLETHPRLVPFWIAFLAFEAAMLGLVLADDIVLLFVFWELTSITSFFLIALEDERARARASAQQALIVTGGGGLALLTGLLLLAQHTGTTQLSGIIAAGLLPGADPLATAAFGLLVLGAATKSAQVPFHFWLPNAMEAPTPVSAYLHSATMVKAGVYLLARMSPALETHPWWEATLLALGGATAVVGALLALQQRDVKRLLAYSTVSALGTLVFLLGAGEAGRIPFILFLLAHALYKGGAFLVAGALDHATGLRELDRLAGLGRALPALATVTGLVVLAATGLPPTIAFVAKEALLEVAWHDLPAGLLIVLLTALAGQTAVAWLLLRPFVGRQPAPHLHPHAPGWSLLTGPALLGSAALTLGLLVGSLAPMVGAVLASLQPTPVSPVKLSLWHGWTPALGLSVLVLGTGAALAAAWPALTRLGDRLATTEPLGDRPTALAAWGTERWYQETLAVATRLAEQQTRALQNGYLRVYVSVIVLTAVTLAAVTVLRRGDDLLQRMPPLRTTQVDLVDAALSVIILVSALVALRATERLAAIAALGALGFSLALLYARFGAPDLAITQVLVDTLTVVLLVFAFYRLPRYARLSTTSARIRDACIAVLFGLTMSTFALLAIGFRAPERISSYFNQQSYLAAHGRNVVNVILVDFRAFDTLGEITVLGLAALGVAALLSTVRRERHS
jgi:multicomponent Na+:H+ antiporter subunit A